MIRVPIQSRAGNIVLGVLGLIYFLAATATLIYYIVTNWGASGLIDHLLQFALAVAALAGLFFILVAAQNLRLLRRGGQEKSRSSPDPRTAAATDR